MSKFISHYIEAGQCVSTKNVGHNLHRNVTLISQNHQLSAALRKVFIMGGIEREQLWPFSFSESKNNLKSCNDTATVDNLSEENMMSENLQWNASSCFLSHHVFSHLSELISLLTLSPRKPGIISWQRIIQVCHQCPPSFIVNLAILHACTTQSQGTARLCRVIVIVLCLLF